MPAWVPLQRSVLRVAHAPAICQVRDVCIRLSTCCNALERKSSEESCCFGAFSSAGRASRLHRECHRFDPGRAHQSKAPRHGRDSRTRSFLSPASTRIRAAWIGDFAEDRQPSVRGSRAAGGEGLVRPASRLRRVAIRGARGAGLIDKPGPDAARGSLAGLRPGGRCLGLLRRQRVARRSAPPPRGRGWGACAGAVPGPSRR